MNKQTFRIVLFHLNLSQLAAARLFKVDPRTIRRWALGEVAIPLSMQALMALLLSGKIDRDMLRMALDWDWSGLAKAEKLAKSAWGARVQAK
jgi:DNA-binding transcriptional regulator YdaS (Cro superfamily)